MRTDKLGSASASTQHTMGPTPGPWHSPKDHCGIYVLDGGECVADTVWLGEERGTERRANARLIAAAPELLEACRAVVERWEHGDLAEAARMCDAAIASATGAEGQVTS